MLGGGPPGGPLRGVPVVVKNESSLPWRAERVGASDALVDLSAPASPGPTGRFGTRAR